MGNRVPQQPLVLTGTVLSASTGKPVANAHVYVIHGEEEALTGGNGEFRIESWQKLPVTLKVQHKDYSSQSITVKEPSKRMLVRLSPSRPR